MHRRGRLSLTAAQDLHPPTGIVTSVIREIRVHCTGSGADARVYEDANQALTTYECFRHPQAGWLVDAVVSTDGKRIERTPPNPLPEWACRELREALDDACGPAHSD